MSQADFINRITNILGLSVKQREVLSDDRCDTVSTIINWKYDEIHDWCTTKSKLTTTRGGASYGEEKIKCLQTLAWWATNLKFRGKQIVLADFDVNIMADCIYEAKLDYKYGKKDPETEKHDKFSHIKWVAW